MLGHELGQQSPYVDLASSVAGNALVRWRPGHHDCHVPSDSVQLETGCAELFRNGLFDVEHRVVSGEPLHQMLGSLVDEAPPQVRQTDDRTAARKLRCYGLQVAMSECIENGLFHEGSGG